MHSGHQEVISHTRIVRRGTKSGDAGRGTVRVRSAALLEPAELESLLLNIEASLRVHSRHHFFGWTQGMLQALIPHDVLVCALCDSQRSSLDVECFTGASVDPQRFAQLIQRDTTLVTSIVGEWVGHDFRPVVYGTAATQPLEPGIVAAALTQIGAPRVIAHGLHDAHGKPSSLFLFAGAADEATDDQSLAVELIVPFVHVAWMRAHLQGPVDAPGVVPKPVYTLTAREKEILHWVHLGKSNLEIGTILSISPFTVKNHLHKILRKLNAQNRAHAVGRAIALHILDS